MNERRPASVAQPGMTAWGRAAERELEVYRRRTAFASPVDFADRVMSAIDAESPSWRHRWALPMLSTVPSRLRMAGGIVTVLVAMLGGAALVGGAASVLMGRDLGAPTLPPPDERPILVAEPTATASEGADATPTTEPLDAAKPPKPPEPNVRDAVEASIEPDVEATTDEPEATDEVDGTDEADATDDGDAPDDGVDEPDETDEPDDDGADGDSGARGDGDEPQEPTGF